jgi:hypothetical protein
MKSKLPSSLILLAMLALSTLSSELSTARAQGTVFTYQGLVTDGGTNFSGTGLFQFALVTGSNVASQATASANPPSGGFITVINVTFGGNGYATAPAATISGGGGSGATATASVSGGAVTSVTVNNPGFGYTSAPTVTIAAPPADLSYTTYWSNDGTSVNGSEPAAAVSVDVSNGLLTVVLGDTTLANMTAIPVAVFTTQSDLQLRIWFNDGVNGFAALSPAQDLTPAARIARRRSSRAVWRRVSHPLRFPRHDGRRQPFFSSPPAHRIHPAAFRDALHAGRELLPA